jgi:hypothetical protein
MKKKYLIAMAAALVIGSGLLMAFSPKNERGADCTESMEKCCEKKENKAPGGMLWESLSRQFFTSSGS